MKTSITHTIGIVLSVLVLLASQSYAADDDNQLKTHADQMDEQASDQSGQGATVVVNKISGDFTDFAGSSENANALVTGLRNGSEITITTQYDNVSSTATFTSPTGKTGYGNVFISLSLAQQQLADLGITQPSAEQIQTALLGGNISPDTLLPGVLTLRADEMGWGQIAKTMGVKLGHVISSIRSANKSDRKEITRLEKMNKSRPDKSNRPQRIDKPSRVEKPARPQRPDKVERPHKN